MPALWSSFQERCSPQKPSSKLSTPTRRSNVLPLLPICQRLFNRPCEVSKHQLSCPSRQASATDSIQAEKELACLLCDRRFKRPCELGRHLQFCKSSRSSATVEPSDDSSSLPCSPRPGASFWNESQMHSVIDQASQTPESAPTSATTTSPLHQHSAGGSEALQFCPTLGQDEAAISSVRVNEPIRVPSSGCKGYWTNANAALEAVIEQSCPGLRSSPLNKPCGNSVQSSTTFSPDQFPHIAAELPDNQLRTTPLFRPVARSSATSVGNGDSAQVNEPLRLLPFAMVFIRPTSKIKRITRQHSAFTEACRQAKEHAEFRKDPYKYVEKSTAMPTVSLEQAEMFSQTSLPMKIGVIAMQGTKTFQTHL